MRRWTAVVIAVLAGCRQEGAPVVAPVAAPVAPPAPTPAPAGASFTLRFRVTGEEDAVRSATEVLRRRLDSVTASQRLGIARAQLEAVSNGQEVVLTVALPPGETCRPERIAGLADLLARQLERRGDLTFHRTVDGPRNELDGLLAIPPGGSLGVERSHLVVTGISREALEKQLRGRLPPPGIRYFIQENVGGPPEEGRMNVWAFESPPALTGAIVERGRAETDDTGGPQIRLWLTEAGRTAFGRLSTELVDRNLGVVFEGEVEFVPRIMEPIQNGEIAIAIEPALGGLTKAQEMAAVLGAGALSAIVQRIDVRPTCVATPRL